MSTPAILILVLVIALIGVALSSASVARRRRDRTSVLEGFLYLCGHTYVRLVHRLTSEIEDGAFDEIDGPLLVVVNHTAGVDPILVSSVIPRRVHWLMAEDMRVPMLDWFWDWIGVIFIARNRHGRTGLRRARKHLADGGVIGIFPEGHIERPHGRLLPFAVGVGVLVQRTGAKVLPVIVDGTPETSSAWESLWTGSDARVRVKKPIDYKGRSMSSAEIAADLQARFVGWTGWEVGERPGGAERESAGDEPEEPEGAVRVDDTGVVIGARSSRRIA
jgi:1-acyl-sn-glycerol-3-phosphate acyltransferase